MVQELQKGLTTVAVLGLPGTFKLWLGPPRSGRLLSRVSRSMGLRLATSEEVRVKPLGGAAV